MNEVELNLTADKESSRSNFVKHPTVWNQKVMRYLDLILSIESERDQLRQQLKTAQDELMQLVPDEMIHDDYADDYSKAVRKGYNESRKQIIEKIHKLLEIKSS